MTPRVVKAYGDRALLVEVDGPSQVHRLRAVVESAGVAVETVPGWRTLLVKTAGDPSRLARWLSDVEVTADGPGGGDDPGQSGGTASAGDLVIVDVVYDGPDLEDVAGMVGRSVDEVVALHTGAEYTVVMLGFSRAFPYLSGLNPALAGISRLATPRTRVPAGSVGIALDQTGIYPMTSPGGWRLVGRTDFVLFDPATWPPSPLRPGGKLRLRAVT